MTEPPARSGEQPVRVGQVGAVLEADVHAVVTGTSAAAWPPAG
ncbi:hypothetical protein ACVGVP_20700 [Pseudonocardia artemisiae]